MKKYIILSLLIVFCLGSSLKAQNKPFIFGFKIAPNLSWMKPDTQDYSSDGSTVGFSWGLMVEFHLMENYKINSGLNVITNGGILKYEEKMENASGELVNGKLIREYDLKYFQIPLTLKMKTNSFGKKSFFGLFGFGTNILLSAKSQDNFVPDLTGSVVHKKRDIKAEMQSLRMSLILGVGMEYELGGATKLITGINFDNGFLDVLAGQNKRNTELQHTSINNFLEFYVGVLF
jgi:hypothetical protein